MAEENFSEEEILEIRGGLVGEVLRDTEDE